MTDQAIGPWKLPSDDPAGPVLSRAVSLLGDNNLSNVEIWKSKNPDSLAVAHLPVYTPRPLIEAGGALPVAFFGLGGIGVLFLERFHIRPFLMVGRIDAG